MSIYIQVFATTSTSCSNIDNPNIRYDLFNRLCFVYLRDIPTRSNIIPDPSSHVVYMCHAGRKLNSVRGWVRARMNFQFN